jgi:predicted PurR-regulated permease PerM
MFSSKIRNGILPLTLVSLIIIGIFYLYWPYVSTVILAGTLAVVLYGPYLRLCKHMTENKAAALVVTAAVIFLAIIITFVISVFINFSGYIANMSLTIVNWLNSLPEIGVMNGRILGSTATITGQFVQNSVIGFASQVPSYLIQIIFFMLSLFLFLIKGNDIIEEIFSVIPDHLHAATMQMRKDVINTLYATYVVNLQICIITFIIAIPFFTLIGAGSQVIPNATLTAVSQLVPTIGPFFVLIYIGLYAIALGDLSTAIFTIIVGCILFLFLPSSILKPKMMGRRVSLPASMMMIAIIGAITVIGLPGVILGPLFAALLVSGYRLLITQMKVIKEDLSENPL